jgi:hypothetical protein
MTFLLWTYSLIGGLSIGFAYLPAVGLLAVAAGIAIAPERSGGHSGT